MKHNAELSPAPTRGGRSIGVLIVDDHPAVRRGIRRLIEDQLDLHIVGEAGNARTAIQLVSHHASVAVVDFHLGEASGLRVVRKLHAFEFRPRILMYSAFADDALAIAAIVAGADGLLNKTAVGSELCAAIRRLAAGQTYHPAITPSVARSLSARLDPVQQDIVSKLLHGIDDEMIAAQTQISARDLVRQRQEILARIAPNANRSLQPTDARGPLRYSRAARPRKPTLPALS